MLFSSVPKPVHIQLNQTSVHRFLGPRRIYPNNRMYNWSVTTSPGLQIKVVLRLFEYSLAQGDFIEFRDGNKNAPLLRNFTSSSSHNQTFPALLSSGPRLWYRFKSDNDFTGAGFEVTRSAVKGRGIY